KKWFVLALASFTGAFVFAAPLLALPVLFNEIAVDLDLTILQIGIIWGSASLAGFLTSIPHGILGDRFGPRITLSMVCLLAGILGALRAFSVDYYTFLGTVLLQGFITPAIPPNVHKVAGAWFPDQRGLAAGLVSAGFALGLVTGSALSASVLSPWLGGWSEVLIFFGIIAIITGAIWFVFYPSTDTMAGSARSGETKSYLASLGVVIKSRQLWYIGLASLCFWGCYRGFSGYLPVYLKTIGWNPVVADQTLTTFYIVSLIGVLPIAIISDRYGIRRHLMIVCLAAVAAAVFSLSLVEGVLIWGVMAGGGLFFDGYMSIHQALAQEAEGIGVAYAGTALGFISTLREVGGFIAPPLGNAFAEFGLAIPFMLWGVFGMIGAIIFLGFPKSSLPN
ncbi:MAG: MFS transporter, partial [Chloroflexota bacterium]